MATLVKVSLHTGIGFQKPFAEVRVEAVPRISESVLLTDPKGYLRLWVVMNVVHNVRFDSALVEVQPAGTDHTDISQLLVAFGYKSGGA